MQEAEQRYRFEKVAIFGYGSLLNQASFEQTLGRSLATNEFSLHYLTGYARSWTLFHNIEEYPIEKRQLLPPQKKYIVYLDITPKKDARIIGSVVNVSTQELSEFDTREKNYSRIDVTAKLDAPPPHDVTVYAYIGDDKYKTKLVPSSECVIIREYIDIIEDGVNILHNADKAEFWKTTIPTDIDIVSIPEFYKE